MTVRFLGDRRESVPVVHRPPNRLGGDAVRAAHFAALRPRIDGVRTWRAWGGSRGRTQSSINGRGVARPARGICGSCALAEASAAARPAGPAPDGLCHGGRRHSDPGGARNRAAGRPVGIGRVKAAKGGFGRRRTIHLNMVPAVGPRRQVLQRAASPPAPLPRGAPGGLSAGTSAAGRPRPVPNTRSAHRCFADCECHWFAEPQAPAAFSWGLFLRADGSIAFNG